MKSKILIVAVLFSALFISCKESKNIDSLDVVETKVEDNTFKVTLNVIVKKDDDFSFYFTQDNSIDFTKIPPVWIGVKGKEIEQSIVCTLPKDVVPTQLRIDFGIKQNQEDIILRSVLLEYNGKTKLISGPELINYFRADETKCTFDNKTGVIKALIKDNKRMYPSLYPQEAILGPELTKLF